MSGTPGNVEVWSACDIFVATDLAATNPAIISTPYNGSWLNFGFIDSDDGIEWSRDGDEKIIWAFGGFPVGMTNKNTLISAKFTAIENSPAVRAELWPGSSPGSIITPPTPLHEDGLRLPRAGHRETSSLHHGKQGDD